MQRLGLLLSMVAGVTNLFAMNEFGSLADVKGKYPDFFRPGVVSKAQLNGEEWYVYAGDAEKCFKEESESELYEEAMVQAKMNFFNHFAKKDPKVEVEVVGAIKMYECADGDMRLAVMGVPVKNVKVIPGANPNSSQTPKPGTVLPAAKPDQGKALPEPAKKQNKITSAQAPQMEKIPSAPAPVVKLEQKSEASESIARDVVDDEEKLDILRERLEKSPNDYHLRIRMARIFAKMGKPRRALNNYNDAARLMILDDLLPSVDKIEDLLEIAKYEESNNEYSHALKHYRALLRMGDREKAKYSNSRISSLLLKAGIF